MSHTEAEHLNQAGREIRSAFPYFEGKQFGAFLDSAASSLKPRSVVERLSQYLLFEHANIHRGAYHLSAEATIAYDHAREKVAQFISAGRAENVIFTRGTTESINLVAYSLGQLLQAGESILLSKLEHHSNIVPWHLLKTRRGVQVHFAGIDKMACLDLNDYEAALKKHRPALVAMTALSNSFGTIFPVQQIIEMAHAAGARVLIDAAQLVAHQPLNVAEWGADFVAFSGHKIYGPTGIGILYMSDQMLEQLPPFHGGGDMIEEVHLAGSTFAQGARKFEAGTPAIAEAIALGTAIDFILDVGFKRIAEHEHRLLRYAIERLSREKNLKLHGPLDQRQSSILAFSMENVHPHDIATIADTFDVQIRAGHHCAMPALAELGLSATARVSFGVYSTAADVDRLIEALAKARELFTP